MKVQEIPAVQVIERIQEQIVPERIEEQIGDCVPPIVEETVEVVHVIPREHLQQRTVVSGVCLKHAFPCLCDRDVSKPSGWPLC